MALLLSPTTQQQLQLSARTDHSSLNDATYGHLRDYEGHYSQKQRLESQRWVLAKKIAVGALHVLVALVAMYTFMLAIKLIGDGFTLALACTTNDVFHFANNPVAGVMIGTIATALLHSSSTITSITVALVGAEAMTIRQGVYVVMGANIGTCVTCIMVAFAQVSQRARFQRAMAAATVHDMYNIWSVIVMFPLEVICHPLEKLSVLMSRAKAGSGAFNSPIDAVVKPVSELLVQIDKEGIYMVATGEKLCAANGTFVTDGAFSTTSLSDGGISAIIAVLGFILLVCSLLTMVKMLARIFIGPAKLLISRLLNFNGYVNILIGTVVTFFVHSSTVVTSIMTPMAGLGVVTLEQVYPIVIGANIGTTGTALLASLVTGKSDAVAIALVHFWFNVFGVFLFYPIPVTRKPILGWARSLAYFSASWPYVAVIFLVAVFLVVPGVLLGLVYLCTAAATSLQVFGWILSSLTCLGLVIFVYWYLALDGYKLWHNFLEKMNQERENQSIDDAA